VGQHGSIFGTFQPDAHIPMPESHPKTTLIRDDMAFWPNIYIHGYDAFE
jgi:hypothetical protein